MQWEQIFPNQSIDVGFLLLGSDASNIEVQNLVDIKMEPNFELAMRLSTDIKNEGIFYTDLNGLQVCEDCRHI